MKKTIVFVLLLCQFFSSFVFSVSAEGGCSQESNVQSEGTFTDSFLFITIQTINIDISLTCDIYGNVT